MSALELITEPLGGSPLSLAIQRGRGINGVGGFPTDIAQWRTLASAVSSEGAREAWLPRLRPALEQPGGTISRLERVARDGGVVITTGQQPGLFGGPLLVLVKALSARALADRVEAVLGVPAAPVFWAATDDADWEEASSVGVAIDERCMQLAATQKPHAGTPMINAPLGDVREAMEVLRRACGSLADGAVFDAVAASYGRGDATTGDAFVSLLRSVLEPLEIAVLDASHTAVREAGGPLMRRALAAAPALAAVLKNQAVELNALGYEPQVSDVPDLSLVFVREDGRKRRIPLADAGRLGREAEPAALSSTVLLRPLLERAILPVLAYTGGPGELAYSIQAAALAAPLGVPQPAFVPRWSTTVVDPKIRKLLKRYSVGLADLRDPRALERRIGRARLSERMERALQDMRVRLANAVDSVAGADEGRLIPERALKRLQATIDAEVGRLEGVLDRQAMRADDKVTRDLARLSSVLAPFGGRQERELSWVPFLVRYGDELTAAMLDAARAHADGLLGDVGAAHERIPQAATPG